ncbi:MAG: hypothetical protein KAT05_14115 [Spirochaetes bacterium]|nr:hypothetical protein [Spirochaetota bacterium]
MVFLDTFYVFVPDISVFRDAFTLDNNTPQQKSARAFLNFLANQSEQAGGFKFLRTPVEFIVKLMNDPLFDDSKIWAFLGLILRAEPIFDGDVSSEEEIVKCFKHLKTYKKPILISNEFKEEYNEFDPSNTSQIMNLLPTIMNDRSFIDRKN